MIGQVGEPIKIRRTNDLRADLAYNTQLITNAIEDEVKKRPEQWNWFLRRWKGFYPELYPEYELKKYLPVL